MEAPNCLGLANIFYHSQMMKSFLKNVFILTDGAISDTEQVLNEIRKFSHQTRVHSFGIGSGASAYLVKEIAKEGKGISTLVNKNDKFLKAKVIKALKSAAKPAFTSFDINWNENSNSIKLFGPQPPKIPMIYEEEPFSLYAIMSEASLWKSNADITFFSTFDFESRKISLEIDPTKIQESKSGKEFQFAAKHYLNYWNSQNKTEKESEEKEIISTSVEYSVLIPKTAIFGFIKNKNKPTQEMQTVDCTVSNTNFWFR